MTNSGSPTSTTRSTHVREHDQLTNHKANVDQEPETIHEDDDEGFGDDFSDFKDETAEDDDFGDFDDGFHAPADDDTPVDEQPPSASYFVSIKHFSLP